MKQNCYVYIHEVGTPDYLDEIANENRYGFDGFGMTESDAKFFVRVFNRYNNPNSRRAYYTMEG